MEIKVRYESGHFITSEIGSMALDKPKSYYCRFHDSKGFILLSYEGKEEMESIMETAILAYEVFGFTPVSK